MNSPDHGIDARLLHILHLLLTEQSVSRTAAILGQSPPAVSVALRRLRQILDDPILVRSGSRLVPTERGQSLIQPVRMALESIDQIVHPDERFDPSQHAREVRIATADCMGPLLLPRLVNIIRREAPQVCLEARSVEVEFDYAQALEEGELDVAIGCWERPPLNTCRKVLLCDDLVCLVRRDHAVTRLPLAGGHLSLGQFIEQDHLLRSTSQIALPGLIADCLAEHGVKRKVAATVPEFSMAPSLLLDSDLVFTTGRQFAEYWARLLPLAIVEAPIEIRPMKTLMLWHERSHRSSASIWLREAIHRAARDLLADRRILPTPQKARSLPRELAASVIG
ncbi:LysR family transcriptional regulator [Marinivivus vitaminiproducens]|uniref:LysR family transcriptional regulator n=1 Tax=Marinivivus vitaminiproducens TaxID=3035935 RepID=UPI002798D51C|nr:LysR family transcriptional regulator [Geminicoccaceae bacterium SCSIO 64248]